MYICTYTIWCTDGHEPIAQNHWSYLSICFLSPALQFTTYNSQATTFKAQFVGFDLLEEIRWFVWLVLTTLDENYRTCSVSIALAITLRDLRDLGQTRRMHAMSSIWVVSLSVFFLRYNIPSLSSVMDNTVVQSTTDSVCPTSRKKGAGVNHNAPSMCPMRDCGRR